jgi:hypothetical protein
MIIYGTRVNQLGKQMLNEKCINCDTQFSVELFVIQKFAHVFWLPLFPMSKTGISQCSHCKQVLKLNEMPDSYRNGYEALKAQTKTPVWTFSGVVVIAGLITWGVVSDKQKDARNSKLILSPQAGDVFEIKTKDNNYTLYKVAALMGDSVLIRANNFETNKVSGLRDLKNKGESAYSEVMIPFSKK